MSTAIFGGSFDPVHNGHLSLVRTVLDNVRDIGRVIVVPAAVSPFKTERSGMAEAHHRLSMCRLAFEGQPKVIVSDIEIKKGGVSYTWETLKAFTEENPGEKLYLILGSDSLKTLPSWNNFRLIMKLSAPIAAARSEEDRLKLEKYADAVRPFGEAVIVRGEMFEISSTEIRKMVSAGEDISPYVPEKAAWYIRENNLYK